MTNTEALLKIIEESGLRKSFIAKEMGLSSYGFQLKVTNKNEFKTSEVNALCKILGIKELEEKEKIFFANEDDL